MPICEKCKEYGLTFQAESIHPEQYIEGSINAKIWIIGLNPKEDPKHVETRTKEQFNAFDPSKYAYFRDFKTVLPKLYENWNSPQSTVAHTDLVKCFSNSFPPHKDRKIMQKVVSNCKGHLINQLKRYKPQVIICNGSVVCQEMLSFFPWESQLNTHSLTTAYKAQILDAERNPFNFWIILSGFIGRIDNYSKRRLGVEIKEILDRENIEL